LASICRSWRTNCWRWLVVDEKKSLLKNVQHDVENAQHHLGMAYHTANMANDHELADEIAVLYHKVSDFVRKSQKRGK
ncbi:hypothetical protein ABTD44_20480, partial [Acinetobacter baumannii]